MAVFKSGLSDVYSQTIVPLLRDFRVVEMEPFDKCLDVFYSELERIRAGVLQSIAALITSKSTSVIINIFCVLGDGPHLCGELILNLKFLRYIY